MVLSIGELIEETIIFGLGGISASQEAHKEKYFCLEHNIKFQRVQFGKRGGYDNYWIGAITHDL